MSRENIMKTYARFDVTFEKGSGVKLYDTEGKEYIDFVSGVAVNCLGHSHPVIVKSLEEQSKKLIHISNLYWSEKQIALAKKLADNTDLDQTFFCNSGTESVEVALKLARKYGKVNGGEEKVEILYMENSFHGRTMGGLSVTGQPKYQAPFAPLLGGVTCVKFNDIEDLKAKMSEKVCAIIVEPVQGEGGVVPANKEFLEAARALCDQFDALLIFDEVQSGVGRSGKLFAYQVVGVVPDVICIAKGLGGGFPIGATLASQKAALAFTPGDHGCTFGGSPLACAVGLAVLEELIDNGVIAGVDAKSAYVVQKVAKLQEKYDFIIGVQGMGLLLGIKHKFQTKAITAKAFEKGLLLIGAGDDVVRILPPLNVTEAEIDAAFEIIEEVFEELKNESNN